MNKSIILFGVNSVLKKLLALLCLTLSLSVSAAPIEYTVTDESGGLTGTFTFDPTTNAYSDVSLTVIGAFSPFNNLRWTLSCVFLIDPADCVSVTALHADSEQLVLSPLGNSDPNDITFTNLSLAFDLLLSSSQSSQVSWSQTLGPFGTLSGTSVATPVSVPSTCDDYVLLTQAEVDAFPQSCDSVRSITLGYPSSPQGPSGPSDIANLDSLSGLTSVEGDLLIWVNNDLTTLAGLDNLNSVGGFFIIEYNSALVNLDGLSGLTSVGATLQIASNASLINLDDLRNLISVGDGLMLENNDTLNNCQGVAPLLGWPSGPANVGNFIQIFSNGSDCNSVEAILASVSGPSQPVISAATGRAQSISLAFPLSTTPDALFPITGYEAECSGLTEIETAQGVGSPLSVGNLTNYREYDCTIAPVTGLGVLPLSSPVSAFAGAVPPSAPQINSIVAGNEEVSINLSAADDGGSPITGYNAYCLDDSNIYQGSSLTSPIRVSGLTNGEAYKCLATATNDVGTSLLSGLSAPVTPEGPADTDADGVPDLIDNCVSIPNADQEPSFVPGCGAACVTSSCAGTFCVNR